MAEQEYALARRIAEAHPVVVVVGELILDDWWHGATERLSREAPVAVVEAGEHRLAPGGAANTAVNLAGLGAEVRLVGALGCDEAGDRLIELLGEAGVDTSFVVREQSLRTVRKTRVLAHDTVLLRVDEGAGTSGGPAPALAASFARARQGAAAVAVCDYGMGVADAVREELRTGERPELLVVDAHDVGPWREASPDIVTPDFAEVERLLGARWSPRHDSSGDGASRREWVAAQRGRLFELSGACRAVVVTLDRDGATALPAGDEPAVETRAVPGPPQQASGAGDTFTAALTAALVTGSALAEATRFAQCAAEVVVASPGTSCCTCEDLAIACRGVIDDHDRLAAIVAAHRRLGRRIVFTNGVFDILHRGHASYLAEARAAGDLLVVAVNADSSVRRLKGPERPINPERDRADVLAELASVDLVTIFDDATPAALISALKPDVYVKGGDYSEAMLAEAQIVRGYGGEVHLSGYVSDHSTTELVEKIRRAPRRARRGSEQWASPEPPRGGRLDVLIPTRDRPAELAVTLSGLAAQDDPEFRVVIGDQSSGAPDWEHPAAAAMVRVLEAQGHPVERLRNLPRRGLAEHRHRLLQHSLRTGPDVVDVLFLDDDVWLEPGQLATMVEARRKLGCGFVGEAVQGLSYLSDVRPHETAAFETWDGPAEPELVRQGLPQYERWPLHNAANLAHVAQSLQLKPRDWLPYKVAWVGGCVLFERAALVESGGFRFWRSLAPEHSGEDVVAQWRVMERRGGAGIVPSGAVHLEAPTTVPDREHDAKERIDTMADTPDSEEVLGYLSGRVYPANRSALIDHAREKGADDAVLDVLGRLPALDYNGPTAVRRALLEELDEAPEGEGGGEVRG
jgi:rfaE bifunctional protein nucleotidyltransferase chain/domain/rfaE bifunctional protein kinase chain/domain